MSYPRDKVGIWLILHATQKWLIFKRPVTINWQKACLLQILQNKLQSLFQCRTTRLHM